LSALFEASPATFVVEELDEPSEHDGAGEHLVLRVRAVGLGTGEVVRRLGRALGVGPRAASYAGRKDVHATIVQRIAFEHADPARLATDEARAAFGEALEVLECKRRAAGLRAGESRGNRFHVTLSGVSAPQDLERRLAKLAARGLPNCFGPQRYGRGGTTAELGRLLVRRDPLAYLDGLAAASDERHREAALELARRARSGSPGEKRRATELCRGLDRELADVARQLARRRDDPEGLVRALSKELRGLHLSALQSRVFDRVLAGRVADGTFDVPRAGDVLLRPGRGPFVLRQPADVGVIAAASLGHLAVSGPMWSPRMVQAEGEVLAAELAALAAEGLTPADLERPGGLAPKGARRALAVPIGEARVAASGGGPADGGGLVQLTFTLPAGAYATTLLEALGVEVRDPVGAKRDRSPNPLDPDPGSGRSGEER